MKIIIVGSGKVGYAITRELSAGNHDITVIDPRTSVLSRVDASLDVLCCEGNGASISVLKSAGAQTADLVIAVTGEDEINLVCCLIAKKLGSKHTIARVRNPEYRRDADMLKEEIGLDMVINPDLAAAREIARIISFPEAFSVEPFASGRVDMIGFQVKATDSLVGKSLAEYGSSRNDQVLICVAEREGKIIVPKGDYVPAAGDKIYVVGAKDELLKMLKGMGRTLQRAHTVSVMGGSRIATYLAWELDTINARIKIMESDHDKCMNLAALLPHSTIIEGDGTDTEVLQSEEILKVDAFVSLTGRDEENLLMALHAKHEGVPKALAKMTRPNYMELVRDTGIDSIVSPKDIIASQITRYVRAMANSEGSKVERLYKMFDGEVEAAEFKVTAGCGPMVGVPLKDLKLKSNILVAAIARGAKTIIPGGLTTLEEGDRVIIVAHDTDLQDIKDIMA